MMKNYIKYTILLFAFAFIYSCSDDDDPITKPKPAADPTIEITFESSYKVDRYDVVKIEPSVTITDGENLETTYQWSIKENAKDSLIGDQKILQFISPYSGEYTLDFAVTCGEITAKSSIKVNVEATGKTYNRRAVKVIDYLPAPYNMYYFFQYVGGDTREGLLEYGQEEFTNGSGLDLGTFGGYIVVQFDHTVINKFGKRDFYVVVNDSEASPLAIQVAYDANNNGIADDNEWYEIAGSEHHKSTTAKNYEITYFRPDAGKEPVSGKYDWQADIEFMKWSDNKGGNGYITRTESADPDDYYPEWMGSSYTFGGTKLYLPIKDVSDGEGTKWNVGTFEWGYGGIKDSNIDISWAVDKDGNKVHLPGIDFVKAYVPTFNQIGKKDLLIATIYDVEDINFVPDNED